ncbi:TPT-domain-containing protein [Sordaria brevicollis]|uniref:TPT-domain-containing protein n=1 Tax=Sordaria brevicollis TaxID=83679 RepID=A0AAE0UB96_SORBR|nr:TPT-domain-containing protein [Sordaria brevicollis]
MSPPTSTNNTNEGASPTTLSVISLDSSPSPTTGNNTPLALPGTSSAFTSGIGTTVGPSGHATPTVSARRTGTGSYNLDFSGDDDPHVTVDTVPVPAGLDTTSATSTLINKQPFDINSAICAEDHAGKDTHTTANLNSDSFDIEMAPIGGAGTGGGHRRRRSSLMNPVGASSSSRHRSPRPRSSAGKGIDSDEPKLVGEDTRVQEVARRDDRLSDDDLTDEDLHIDEEAGLTGADRRRKSRKRSRNTRIDQRIARDRITEAEKQEADKAVLKNLVINVTLILLWYFFSLSISLYNKWMFDPNKLNFRFPLFTTATHMLVQFSLASVVLFFFPSLRPTNGHKSDLGQSRHEPERPVMTKWFYLTRIGPCGLATGLDIGLGNASLQFITLTFYTMCKSSSLAFVLLFAFLFRLESPTWRLVAIIATMTLGVVMMVAGEVEFKLGGFLLVISASFFSGFRWGLTQILLLRNPATSNPFSSIFFLAPVMFLSLISIAIPVEGFSALFAGLKIIAEEHGMLMAPLLILFPGTIAFLMTASEFALLKRTSVVTLSIAGIFKEAVTISAAAIVFGDTMTVINVMGLLVTLAAIATYNYMKIKKMRQDAQTNVHMAHMVGSGNGSSGSSSSASTSRSGSRSGSGVGSSCSSERDGEGEDVEDEGRGLLDGGVAETLFTADGEAVKRSPDSPATRGRGRSAV